MRLTLRVLRVVALALAAPAIAMAAETGSDEGAGEHDAGDLAKATQNPVADMISVPFQNNTNYNVGPNERASNTLNIQPVIPVHLGEHVLMISRIIVPIVFQPDLNSTTGESSGLGDTNPTFFFSPANQSKLIWGVGPAFLLPTATQRAVGTGKWSAGPAAVVLVQPGKWTIGALGSQIWSFAGPDDRSAVSLMTIQYFVNYNLPDAWYLTTSPILTFNWKAQSSEEWVVPFGGGVGKIFKIGKLPFNGGLQASTMSVRRIRKRSAAGRCDSGSRCCSRPRSLPRPNPPRSRATPARRPRSNPRPSPPRIPPGGDRNSTLPVRG